MRCLVTGSHGFVGRSFARRLCDDGHTVVCVDDMSNGKPMASWAFRPHRWFEETHKIDCREFFGIRNASEFDLIIHCAAVIGSRLRDNTPLAVAENLAIDTAFFQWCTKTKPRKVVYFSSSAAYGTHYQQRIMNTSLIERQLRFDSGAEVVGIPDGMYGWAKLTGEYLAQQAVARHGLDVVIYRPQSGYGEDQSLDYPLPRIVQRVVDREDPIVIWGSGEQSRDFIHIDDIVEAVLISKDEMDPGEVLNLGSGKPTAFRALVEMALEARGSHTSYQPSIRTDLTKPEGTFTRYCDTTRLHTFYKPKVSLAAGIERVYRHLSRKESLTPVNDPVV